MKTRIRAGAFALLAALAACRDQAPAPLYEPVAVARRDIVVSAEAAGTIEPIRIVEVKSKASGEIIELRAETGDLVQRGELLVQVDPREPRNQVAQAEADLEVARAQLTTAESQKRRADDLFQAQLVSEQEHEQAILAHANARAQLVRAERALQAARDQLDDTNVRAPITGTVIQKNVERGQVIASATREVSGGTVLLRMADLSEMQVRALVDETDIGKIQASMRATITVDAYPNRPFTGTVLKIEPQSVVQQNVTMFPVLIRIANREGLLRPGMNAEVEIHVAQRSNVLAIPNAALRTSRDVASAATVLGLDPREVDAILARADSQRAAEAAAAPSQTSQGGSVEAASGPRAPGDGAAGADPARMRFVLPEGVSPEMAAEIRRKRLAGEALTPAESTAAGRIREQRQRMLEQGGAGPAGAAPGAAGAPQSGAAQAPAGASERPQVRLPPGVTEEQARAIFAKLRSGQSLTAREQAVMARVRAMGGGARSGTRSRTGAASSFQFGGSFIVFVLRDGRPTPVRVRTGVTDLDYSEVVSGLTEADTVLLLPSASLLQSQAEWRERFQRFAGRGVPGMRQQQPQQPQTARPQGR